MSRPLSLALLAATVAIVGCGANESAIGAGPEVDACGGYRAFDELPEPEPEDSEAVLSWSLGVQRVIERTDLERDVTDREGDRREVPNEVVDAFGALNHSILELRQRVSANATKDPAAVRRAADELARDTDFAEADGVVREFVAEACR